MGPGDTIIRFREKIQGLRDQKNCIILGTCRDISRTELLLLWLSIPTRESKPPPWQPVCAWHSQFRNLCCEYPTWYFIPSDLSFWSWPLILLDQETKQQLPVTLLHLCPVPTRADADLGSAGWCLGSFYLMNNPPPPMMPLWQHPAIWHRSDGEAQTQLAFK